MSEEQQEKNSSNPAQSQPKEKPSRKRRFIRTVITTIALIALYNGCCSTMVNRHDAKVPRNTATGILIGAEPLTLGPENANTAILFIHGFVGGSNNFWEIPNQLAEEGYRVHAMLLPGHGTSPRDFAKAEKQEFHVAINAEIEKLKAKHEKVILVGHSMGGALSTIAASEQHVDGIILGGPYFGVTYNWYYILPVETWSKITEPVLPWVYKSKAFVCVNREDAKDQILSYKWIPAKGTATLHKIGSHANSDETLAKVTCPVLLLHAPGDFAAAYQASQSAFERMASENKKFVDLPNSDHHVFWDNDRDLLAEEIKLFVKAINESEG